MRQVYNNSLGISTEDVKACNDRVQLKQWKADMEIHIAEIESQLREVRSKQIETGKYADPEWYSRTNMYKRYQSGLKAQIDARLSSLKKEEAKHNDYIEKTFWKAKLRELIGEEELRRYYPELDKLLEGNTC